MKPYTHKWHPGYSTAKFRWKCRNCGKKFFDGTECGSEMAFPTLINVIFNIKTTQGSGEPSNNKTYHRCKKNQMGIADLIGYEVVK
jgi:hypothetical protein